MCPEQVDRCMSIQRYYLPDSITTARCVLLWWAEWVFEVCMINRNAWHMVEIFMQSDMLAVSVWSTSDISYPNARIVVSENEVCDTSYTASDIAHRGNQNIHISLWCCWRAWDFSVTALFIKRKNEEKSLITESLISLFQQETPASWHRRFCFAKS